MLAVWLIAGCGSTFWQPAVTQGQESVVAVPVPTTVPAPIPIPAKKHLGSGPVDLNNLSPDILNCDICRQRLGLPPLQRPNTAPAAAPLNKANLQPGADLSNFAPVRMLGSPGSITSGTASQMATEGLVVEEFKPPMPEAGAINLGGLPLEVRQQFMQSLELPEGATIMSAQIAIGDQKPSIEPAKPSEEKEKEKVAAVNPFPALPTPPPALPEKPQSSESAAAQTSDAPDPGSASEDSNSKPSPKVESTESPASAPSETAASSEIESKMQAQLDSMKQAQIEMEQKAEAAAREMAESMAKMRAEADEKLLRIEASKREIAKMLEARTKEVSELQAALKETERELAQAKASAKKKAPKKNQDHPKKPKSESAKDL